MDDPSGSERKIHSDVIPRSGGLGIILPAAVSALIVLPLDGSLLSFLLACLVIISFGFLDDIVELKPIQKLGGQAIGIVIAMLGGMVILELPFGIFLPEWVCYIVTFFFVLGVINGVNFSDGMDGLAAGTTLMGLALIFILAIESADTEVAVVSLAISAALLGFLRFNTHPARIFMGDAGSQFLGIALAWLTIEVSQTETSQVTKLLPLLILGIPVMDVLQVVMVRIRKRLPLKGPDREHFHHQIAKLGFYQYEVVALIYVLQTILLGIAYLLRFSDDQFVLLFYSCFVATTLGWIYIGNSSGWLVREPVAILKRDRRNTFFRRLSDLHPYTAYFFGAFLALFLLGGAFFTQELPGEFASIGLLSSVLLTASILFFLPSVPLYIGRVTSYLAVIILSYGEAVTLQGEAINMFIDGVLAVIAVLLVLAMRITRKEYFGLTTEDLLVAIFVIAIVPLLLVEFDLSSTVSRLIFRVLILLYACEYLLARGPRATRLLAFISVGSLFLMALRV